MPDRATAAAPAAPLPPRHRVRLLQDSSSSAVMTQSGYLGLPEWKIPFRAIRLGGLISRGRFSTVYKGQWHGEVAIKVSTSHQL